MLAMSVSSMLLLVAVVVALVGLIAWLSPRPGGSLTVRRVGSDDTPDR